MTVISNPELLPTPLLVALDNPTTNLQNYLEEIRKPLFLAFVASKDPATAQPWCPDVRAALPVLAEIFEGSEQELLLIEVGAKDVWKSADNKFRKEWGLQAIPTLARYDLMDIEGEVIVGVRMLVEAECLDGGKILQLAA